MSCVELLLHTLQWGLSFIVVFNTGILLGAALLIAHNRRMKRREERDKDIS